MSDKMTCPVGVRRPLVVAGTGHRPPRLGLDYSPESNRRLTEFARRELSALLLRHDVVELVSGMAQGWDQALAHAAILLGIPLVCALPFEGMGDNWPEPARRRRDAILARAKLVHALYRCGYDVAGNASYHERDVWMVNRAGAAGGILLALWDGSEKGGTWLTVDYARRRGVGVVNVWAKWAGVSSSGEEATHDPGAHRMGDPAGQG